MEAAQVRNEEGRKAGIKQSDTLCANSRLLVSCLPAFLKISWEAILNGRPCRGIAKHNDMLNDESILQSTWN
jgi:hypothetical protein